MQFIREEQISLDRLHPHPKNPRRDLGDLTELAESIRKEGLLQPLVVIPAAPGAYTVVIGHRRRAAAIKAGIASAKCLIYQMTETEQLKTMLTENIQRSDLTLYEEAKGFEQLTMLGMSPKEIAETSGFSETTVRRRIKIAKLPEEAMQISQGTLEEYLAVCELPEEYQEEAARAAGTAMFQAKLSSIKSQIKWDKAKARAIEELRMAQIPQLEKPDYDFLQAEERCAQWNPSPFERLDKAAGWYDAGDQIITFSKRAEPGTVELNPTQRYRVKINEITDALRAVNEKHYHRRIDFVKGLKNADKNLVLMTLVNLIRTENTRRLNGEYGWYSTTNDVKLRELTKGKEKDAALYILGHIFATYDSAALGYWKRMFGGAEAITYFKNDVLDAIYGLLADLGYVPGDDEVLMMNDRCALIRDAEDARDKLLKEENS